MPIKKCKNPKFTFGFRDLLDFVGIFLLNGYHKLLHEDIYWEISEDVEVPLVSRQMSRNKFREIKRYFNAPDSNNLNRNDKTSKHKPMIEATNTSLQ